MNVEMIDCAVELLVDVDVAVGWPAEAALEEPLLALELAPVRALMMLWNAELSADVTLLEASAPPSRSPSSALSLEACASDERAASAPAVLDEGAVAEDAAVDELGVEAVTAAFSRLDRLELVLLTFPIDITASAAIPELAFIGASPWNLRSVAQRELSDPGTRSQFSPRTRMILRKMLRLSGGRALIPRIALRAAASCSRPMTGLWMGSLEFICLRDSATASEL
jgi:hypothetical protein